MPPCFLLGRALFFPLFGAHAATSVAFGLPASWERGRPLLRGPPRRLVNPAAHSPWPVKDLPDVVAARHRVRACGAWGSELGAEPLARHAGSAAAPAPRRVRAWETKFPHATLRGPDSPAWGKRPATRPGAGWATPPLESPGPRRACRRASPRGSPVPPPVVRPADGCVYVATPGRLPEEDPRLFSEACLVEGLAGDAVAVTAPREAKFSLRRLGSSSSVTPGSPPDSPRRLTHARRLLPGTLKPGACGVPRRIRTGAAAPTQAPNEAPTPRAAPRGASRSATPRTVANSAVGPSPKPTTSPRQWRL
ncbi:uncharacterized protein Tco025E_07804 [Trypanosoma conorhini]|uniref:Uncharacterized protein n=1 Tax=Trypanosoma conorhini TaxID=83891 RepID=A0A422NJX5_9TRYP|nr:uncharacterized protein Tco025E_07804 [Trypanosoma conorhini]RNF05629.1 hypothetical protein Tco025E_07804 [Trypanosoma conorhini]